MGDEGAADHDGAYKTLFSHPLMVESLLEGFVSAELAGSLDFSEMTPVNVEFRSRTLQKRTSDMIWKIPLGGGEELHLMLMIEFQSSVDHKMAARVLNYVSLLYDQVLKTQGNSLAVTVPAVLPIVIHTGARTWNAKTSVLELVDIERGTILDDYQPNLSYYLVDTRRLGEDVLEEVGGPAALLFELERVTALEGFEAKLDKIKGVFRLDRELGELFIIWMENVLGRGRNKVMLSDAQLEEVTEGVDMLRETVKRWEKELREEGREEGRAEGLRVLLLKLLAVRFGEGEGRSESVAELSSERAEEVIERLMRRDEYPDEASVFEFDG